MEAAKGRGVNAPRGSEIVCRRVGGGVVSKDAEVMEGLEEALEGCGVERRDFLRKLLVAGAGVPAGASLLLAGCGGDDDNDLANGDLSVALFRWRCWLLQWITQIQRSPTPGSFNSAALFSALNPEYATVWSLMILAAASTLRANVADDMQEVLSNLGSDDPDYEGAPRTVSEQQLLAARDRADSMVDLTSPTDSDRSLWVFLLMTFLLFPTVAGSLALGWAGAAQAMDTQDMAVQAFFWFNPTTTQLWSAGLVADLSVVFLALALYLYLAMGTAARTAPGLLFGRDWAVLLMLLVLVLTVSFAEGA